MNEPPGHVETSALKTLTTIAPTPQVPPRGKRIPSDIVEVVMLNYRVAAIGIKIMTLLLGIISTYDSCRQGWSLSGPTPEVQYLAESYTM